MRLNKTPAVDAAFIFILYFLPVLLWCWYFPAPPSLAWLSLSAGIVMASLGSILLYLGFAKNDLPSQEIYQPLPENLEPHTSAPPLYPDLSHDLTESQAHVKSLSDEIEVLKQEISFQKNVRLTDLEAKETEIKKLKTETESLKKEVKEKEKIVEQQSAKLNDLDYEIKTLIDVKEQEDEAIIAESDSLTLAQTIKRKIEEATSGAHLDQLIKSDAPSFIFLYNVPYRAVVATSGATSELNAEDLSDLLPLNTTGWHEAMATIEKGRSASITLTNKTEVTLAPITHGPYKGLILGVSEF